MEVLGLRKVLSDQNGAHHAAACVANEAAIGLVGEDQLGQAGHEQRIPDTAHDRQRESGQDGSTRELTWRNQATIR